MQHVLRVMVFVFFLVLFIVYLLFLCVVYKCNYIFLLLLQQFQVELNQLCFVVQLHLFFFRQLKLYLFCMHGNQLQIKSMSNHFVCKHMKQLKASICKRNIYENFIFNSISQSSHFPTNKNISLRSLLY